MLWWHLMRGLSKLVLGHQHNALLAADVQAVRLLKY